jgi:hypothetical protein
VQLVEHNPLLICIIDELRKRLAKGSSRAFFDKSLLCGTPAPATSANHRTTDEVHDLAFVTSMPHGRAA